jgi:hypothetical protein
VLNQRVFVILFSTVLCCLAPTAMAEEANPLPTLPVRAIVGAGEVCPSAPTGSKVPQFRTGDTMLLCLAQHPPTTAGATGIMIGSAQGVVGNLTDDTVTVALPQTLTAGDYAVTGTINGAAISQSLIQLFPPPKPVVTGLSESTIVRGAKFRIDGQDLSAPMDRVSVSVGSEPAVVTDVDPNGRYLVASVNPIPGSPPASVQQAVHVTVWGVPATPQTGPLLLTVQGTDSAQTVRIALLALVPLAVVIGLIMIAYYSQRRTTRNLLAALLYDSVTQTYSLSRAQFFWWLTIVAYGYTFLFIGRGVTAGDWVFPPLNGLLLTLVISTGTLLGAIVTSNVRGQKGSGTVHPSLADLITNGGVIAPERIQQLLWSLLAGVAVLWIVLSTYTTATALPDIPQELLALMGLSSAAYVTGKIVRTPGPIIRQVDVQPNANPVQLVVSGDCLDKNATITVNRERLPVASVAVGPNLTAAEASQQLVSRLTLTTTIPPEVWTAGMSARTNKIVIVNTDGQRSEWPNDETFAEALPAANTAALAAAAELVPSAAANA